MLASYQKETKTATILKEDTVKMLHSMCQQIWKTQQWPQDWKRSVFIPIPRKGNTKDCSNYLTIVLISHSSKVMLKILQARLHCGNILSSPIYDGKSPLALLPSVPQLFLRVPQGSSTCMMGEVCSFLPAASPGSSLYS